MYGDAATTSHYNWQYSLEIDEASKPRTPEAVRDLFFSHFFCKMWGPHLFLVHRNDQECPLGPPRVGSTVGRFTVAKVTPQEVMLYRDRKIFAKPFPPLLPACCSSLLLHLFASYWDWLRL